jgi:hypothetical protein
LLGLLQKAIKAQGDFSQFQNRDYVAGFNYLSVRNAISFDVTSGSYSQDSRYRLGEELRGSQQKRSLF